MPIEERLMRPIDKSGSFPYDLQLAEILRQEIGDQGAPAEAYRLPSENELAALHNDNWRLWDDDMTVGSVHTVEMLELLYWLDRMGYDGWYALDIFPYREDGIQAATESIRWIKGLHGLLDKIGRDRIGEVVASGDAMEASALVREALLG